MWHRKTRSSQLSSMCKSWSASPPQVVAMLGSRFSVLDLAQMHNLCIHELGVEYGSTYAPVQCRCVADRRKKETAGGG
jgi:hypothetical protein